MSVVSEYEIKLFSTETSSMGDQQAKYPRGIT
jgi:hypothetical protein